MSELPQDMAGESVLLEARDLVAGHRLPKGGVRRVVEGLSVSLRPGRLVAILGPNGAGKTTLMRTLTGLLPPLSGQVLFASEPLSSLPIDRRAHHLATVLTDRVQVGAMLVSELVGLGRLPHQSWSARMAESDRLIVESSLQTVGATSLSGRRVSKLSDGERQRVLFARALAQETPVLFADEPTAFLDPPNEESIGTLLRQLANAGRAVLIATHRLDLALRFADELWLIPTSGPPRLGGPEDLGLAGALEEVFLGTEDLRTFDPGTARLIRTSVGPLVACDVPGPERLWVQRAIERAGCRIAQDPEMEAPFRVTGRAATTTAPASWVLERPDGRRASTVTLAGLSLRLAEASKE